MSTLNEVMYGISSLNSSRIQIGSYKDNEEVDMLLFVVNSFHLISIT